MPKVMVEKVMVEKRDRKRKLSNIPRKGIYYDKFLGRIHSWRIQNGTTIEGTGTT